MKVKDGYTNTKAVTFNMQDRLDDKIDKLTAQGNKPDKQFKSKIYQGKKRGMMKHNYHQGNYLTRNGLHSGNSRMSLEIWVVLDRIINRIIEEDCSILIVTEMTSGEKIIEMQNYKRSEL